ncbi:hypothetical protein RUM43_001567 [Polyplax serrata]|uniref:Uncharacterized protein n=1 Tax=Polyplax serrata TaxID=468196 RepID=A0AAN8SGG6_POLSC
MGSETAKAEDNRRRSKTHKLNKNPEANQQESTAKMKRRATAQGKMKRSKQDLYSTEESGKRSRKVRGRWNRRTIDRARERNPRNVVPDLEIDKE